MSVNFLPPIASKPIASNMSISPSNNLKRPLVNQELRIVKKRKLDTQQNQILQLDFSSSCQLTDEIFSNLLNNFSSLKELSWNCGSNEVTDKSLTILKKKVQNLTHLNLKSAGKITEQALSELLSQTAQLRFLNLHACGQITNLFAVALEHCPFLEELDLGRCANVTDRTIELIAKNSPRLKFLNLEGCEKCTDEALRALAQSSSGIGLSLEHLNISRSSSMTDQGIEALSSKVTNLKLINLSCCESVTDAVIPLLGSLKKLESLDLSLCSKLTDASFEMLDEHHFSSLQRLNLSDTSVTHQTVRKLTQIGAVSFLCSLNLNSCPGIDAEVLDHLPLLKLTHLEMAHNTLNRFLGTIGKLARCTQLEFLNISYLEFFKSDRFSPTNVISLVKLMSYNLKKLQIAGLGRQSEFQEIATLNPQLKLRF